MTYSFTRTREQCATLVLGKLGIIAAGQTAASADTDLVYEAIDLRLKEMHKYGIVWRNVPKTALTFPTVAGVNSASASVDILFPIKMTVVDGQNDEPLKIIGVREYAAIPDKTESGTPTKALWRGGAEFILHPVPTTSANVKLVYEQIADDTAASTAPDVDVSMLRSLCNIVAYDVADHYGVDEVKIQRWQRDSVRAEIDLRRLGAERKDYEPVAVEQWDESESTETDYGR